MIVSRRAPIPLLLALAGLAAWLGAGCDLLLWGQTVGPQGTLVVIVDAQQEGVLLSSQEEVRGAVEKADDWMRQASHGQLWLEDPSDPRQPAHILGPIQLSSPILGCDDPQFLDTLRDDALAHPDVWPWVEAHIDALDRVVLAVGHYTCTYAAGIGGSVERYHADGARQRFSTAFVLRGHHWSPIVHELLHGMGLGHGYHLDCEEGARSPEACVAEGGRTLLNLMGTRHRALIDVGMQRTLGWLDCEPAAAGGAPTRLDAVELAEPGAARCVTIPVEGGELLLEHRAPLGLDLLPMDDLRGPPNVFQGVSIYYAPREERSSAYLQLPSYQLSMGQLAGERPCAGKGWDTCGRLRPALEEGQTYEHFDGTRITVLDHRPFSSIVSVEMPR